MVTRPKVKSSRWRYLAIVGVFLAAGTLALLIKDAKKTPQAHSLIYRDITDRLNHASWSSFANIHHSPGVCVLDANGDGWDDIFIPGIGYLNTDPSLVPGFQPGNHLFLNKGLDKEGIPSFEEIGESAGIRNIEKLGVGCAAADYDNDGDLDILVTDSTESMIYSGFGHIDYTRGIRVYPPEEIFASKKTDGKYDFPKEGGVTLFENLGGSVPHFRDRTLEAGLTLGGNGTSAAWADIDNDGWTDLYVGNYVDKDFIGFTWTSFAGRFNALYRNNRNGTFTEVGAGTPVVGQMEYLYDEEDKSSPSWTSDEKDSRGQVVGDPAGNTLAVAFTDFNEDGLQDLVTADDVPGKIRIFRNTGDFQFEEEKGFAVGGSWMGIAIGDVNGDGKLDLFATNSGGPAGSRFRRLSEVEERAGNSAGGTFMGNSYLRSSSTPYHGLWLGSENGSLRNIAREIDVSWGIWDPATDSYPRGKDAKIPPPQGLERGEFGFGALMYDYDNDGDKDIAWIGNLWRAAVMRLDDRNVLNPGRLLENDGSGLKFKNVANTSGFFNLEDPTDRTSAETGRGLAMGDFNNDGFADVIAGNSGGWDSLNKEPLPHIGQQYRFLAFINEFRAGPTQLFLATPNGNNWIKVKLRGTKSNRDGIGARICLTYLENGSIKKQVQEVRAGESYASQSSLNQIFGLGSANRVEEITVHWPSGIVQKITDISSNQLLAITEPL